MGTGYHGGFGHTSRASDRAVSLSPSYTGDDADLGKAVKWLKPKEGYTDIVIHGQQDSVQIKRGDKWITLDHRRLAKMYKHDKELSKKPVRLVSCYTGKKVNGFAQNLANKLGKTVLAPSDKVWIHASGKVTIGPTALKNTGHWIEYKPQKERRK